MGRERFKINSLNDQCEFAWLKPPDEETSGTDGNTKGPITTRVIKQIQSPAGDPGAIPLLSSPSRLHSQLFSDASPSSSARHD